MKPATDNGLSPEIEVLREPDRTIYQLPSRDFGKWRRLGFVPIVIGLLILFRAATFAWNVSFENNLAHDWTDRVFGSIIILVGLAIAYIPLGLGLAIVWGRREIVLRGGKLRTTERAGPFWRTKRWPIANIERLTVIGLSGKSEPAPNAFLAKLDALVGNLRDGKRFMIAPAFPLTLLGPLAEDLAKTCDRFARQRSAEPPEPIVVSLPRAKRRRPAKIVDEEIGNEEPNLIETNSDDEDAEPTDVRDEPLRQPVDSRVQVERSATGLTLTIPPAGVWKGSRGLLLFGVLWCAGIGVITAIFAGAANDVKSLLAPAAFLSLFWLVGIGLMLAGINMGRRRAAIAIVDDDLLVLQTGILRSKSNQWRRGDVATVQVGPSGMEVNDRPVLELQIISSAGDKLGLLAGRDEAELRWMAYEARQSLQLTAPQRQGAVDEIMHRDVVDQPAGSRIAIETFPSGFSLTIPPSGIWRGSHGFVGLGLFLIAVMLGLTGAETFFGMSIVAHPFGAFFTLGGWGIAVAVLVSGINIGTRRAAVGVANDRLLIVQTSLLGSKKREYQSDEVTAARAAPSGQSKDYEGLVELQILTKIGDRQSFLCGEDKHELFWIATLIRQALDVPAETTDETDATGDETDDEEDDELGEDALEESDGRKLS